MFGLVPFLPLFLGGEQDTSQLFGVLSSSTRSKCRRLPPFIILSKNITLRLPHQGNGCAGDGAQHKVTGRHKGGFLGPLPPRADPSQRITNP